MDLRLKIFDFKVLKLREGINYVMYDDGCKEGKGVLCWGCFGGRGEV